MGYVPNFEWDIFISYPRESNERDSGDFNWVSEFHRLLKKEINERLSDKAGARIYFDQLEFKAFNDSKHDLLEAARHSALFLPVVSPLYVAEGKFTLDELAAFCEAGDVTKRIVTIELLPVSTAEGRPKALQGPKRNNFYVKEDGTAIKLRPTERYQDDYANAVQMVAEHIKERLREMRRDGGGTIPEDKKAFSGKIAVLAEKEEDIDRDWEHVRGWLQDYGVTILPSDGKYPENEAESSDAIKADLKRADLFIQLLSPWDEIRRRLDGKPSRAQLQYQAARESGKPILQWRPALKPQLQTQWNEKFQSFLEIRDVVIAPDVQRDEPIQRVERVRQFENEIKAKLIELSKPPIVIARRTTRPYVYITADDTSDADFKLAFDLKELAENKLNLEASIMTSQKKAQNFKDNVKNTDVIIFLYGAGSPAFIDEWLSTYNKLKSTGKTKPPQVEALYRAPPPKTDIRQKLRVSYGSFLQLGSEETITLEGMHAIVEELQRRSNATVQTAAT